MKRIFIGSGNPSKIDYFKNDLLRNSGLDFVTPYDLGLEHFEAREEANLPRDNALQKALSWYDQVHMPVFANDAGLFFLDLPEEHPDQPGVHVRRASGKVMTDQELLDWFIDIIHRHGGMMRVVWVDAFCILKNPDEYETLYRNAQDMERHAYYMIDTPCEKRVPGWPLDSLGYDPVKKQYLLDIQQANEVKGGTEEDPLCEQLRQAIRRLNL